MLEQRLGRRAAERTAERAAGRTAVAAAEGQAQRARERAADRRRCERRFDVDCAAMDASELAYAGIARQAELIAAGEVSARELLDVYLARIERFDPLLNAFRVVFAERSRLEADQADARRRSEEHTSELQSRGHLVCRLLLEKK